MDFLCFASENFDNTIENEACRDTIGNAVADSHKDTCEERRNRLIQVSPLNLLEGTEHHDTNSN